MTKPIDPIIEAATKATANNESRMFGAQIISASNHPMVAAILNSATAGLVVGAATDASTAGAAMMATAFSTAVNKGIGWKI